MQELLFCYGLSWIAQKYKREANTPRKTKCNKYNNRVVWQDATVVAIAMLSVATNLCPTSLKLATATFMPAVCGTKQHCLASLAL